MRPYLPLRYLLASLALWISTASPAADVTIDPEHSYAEFGVRLLWVHQITGVFEKVRGEISLNRERDLATVDAWLDTAGIRMDSSRLKGWVLEPEFFDAEHYPHIHFVSDPISFSALAKGGELTGRLSIRGVTRPATFLLMPSSCSPTNLEGCTIEARGSIARSDFGMHGRRAALSDRVDLGMVIVLHR
jgi:polyisoprenoid-binding protein YceI